MPEEAKAGPGDVRLWAALVSEGRLSQKHCVPHGILTPHVAAAQPRSH